MIRPRKSDVRVRYFANRPAWRRIRNAIGLAILLALVFLAAMHAFNVARLV